MLKRAAEDAPNDKSGWKHSGRTVSLGAFPSVGVGLGSLGNRRCTGPWNGRTRASRSTFPQPLGGRRMAGVHTTSRETSGMQCRYPACGH